MRRRASVGEVGFSAFENSVPGLIACRMGDRIVESCRDFLFVSYAWENGALAEWLTLKLTALGYRVWCDRFQMLGGDPWPADVDDAIKNHTFRMLHLVSKYSLAKPNPTKERELALAIGRERDIPDFLIPLNVDGTKPTELPWRLIDITYIPFEDWASGLGQLVKKLERIDTPRPLFRQGRAVAAEAFLPVRVVVEEAERLSSNCYAFVRVPEVVRRYAFSRPLYDSDGAMLSDRWAFRAVDDRRALAFGPPPELPVQMTVRDVGGSLWRFDGANAGDVVAELLRKSVQVELLRRGLRWTPERRALFFPAGLLEQDRIRFRSYTGKRTWVSVGGKRTKVGSALRYRLGVALWVRRDVIPGFALLVKLRLFLLDREGKPIEGASSASLRRMAAGNWFNHAFLSRHLAVASFLANGGPAIVIASDTSGGSIALSAESVGGTVARRVDEELLKRVGGAVAGPIGDDEEGHGPEDGE